MKKSVLVLFTLFTVCSLAACSKTSSKPVETAVTTEAETTEQETTTPAAEQTAPGNTSEFKILEAKVREVSDTMTDMTVEADGTAITFDLSSAVVETSYAMDPGTDVTVIYKGEVSGSNASNAKVLLVLDAQEQMTVQEVTGNVVEQAMSSFSVKLAGGEEMGFLKDNCEGLSTDVLGQGTDDSNASGNKVKITYVTVNYDAGSQANYPLKVEPAQ